jgi:hypothetical protein
MYNNRYLIDIVNMLVEDIRNRVPFWNNGIKHYPNIPRKTLCGLYNVNLHIWIDREWECFIMKVDGEKEFQFKIGGDIDRLIPKLQRFAQKKWLGLKREKL